jgi:hypothetical protein
MAEAAQIEEDITKAMAPHDDSHLREGAANRGLSSHTFAPTNFAIADEVKRIE